MKTSVDSVMFKYGTKWNRVDIVGVYGKDEQYQFVGIEVKNSATTHQTALRQAQALQAICHEVIKKYHVQSIDLHL